MRTCTISGCNKPVSARELCKTHYNKSRLQLQPVTCDGCGIEYQVQRANRGATHHCSELCRQWSQFGAWSSDLPAKHPARWQPSRLIIEPKTPPQRECTWCGNAFPSFQPHAAYCSPRCRNRRHKARRRAAEQGAAGEYTYTEIMRLYYKQGRVCAYCQQTIDGLPDPEHVVPLSRGGRNDTTNLVAACRACNTDKGDLTLAEWSIDRDRRSLPTVRTALDSPEYRHLIPSAVTRSAWRHRENTRSIAA